MKSAQHRGKMTEKLVFAKYYFSLSV